MAASLKLVEDKKVDADRQKALDAALAQIDRAFGKGSAMKLGQKETMQVEAISTGSLGLDIALGVGGLPKGRVIEVYGPESSGKTTLALHVLAEHQECHAAHRRAQARRESPRTPAAPTHVVHVVDVDAHATPVRAAQPAAEGPV